jgi:hypothetical protein
MESPELEAVAELIGVLSEAWGPLDPNVKVLLAGAYESLRLCARAAELATTKAPIASESA